MTAAMPHHVEWGIDNGCEPRARFTCIAQPGAGCRLWCAVGCEEVCAHQPVTRVEPDGTRVVIGHPWEDTGECRIVVWLTNGGTPGELYMGEDEPLRSGPIETEWDGDCYLWQYADEPAGQGGVW